MAATLLEAPPHYGTTGAWAGRAGRWDALVLGAAAFALSVALSWVPSVWYDEAATIVSATRTWPELVRMLGTVDAVHGLYYAGLHVWFELVGYSPFTLRLPSAVAVGVATAGLVALLRILVPRRVGIAAGIMFAVLPRVVWAGGEGRSYALTAALAVALLALFTHAARTATATPRVRIAWWAAYGLAAAIGCAIFLYLALAVLASGVTLLLMALRGAPRIRRTALGWAISSAAAALVLSPLAALIVAQSKQISWILPLGPASIRMVLMQQLFGNNVWLAVVVLGAVAAALGLASSAALHRPRPESVGGGEGPTPVELFAPALLVPLAALLVGSAVLEPLYSPRYLTFTAAPAAVLAAIAFSALPGRASLPVAVACVIGLAFPTLLELREPDAKQNSSWSSVAALVARERAAERGGTVDAIVYGPVLRHPSATTRVIAYAYPQAFEGMIDVTLETPARESGGLWETREPLEESLHRLSAADSVWLVTSDRPEGRPEVAARVLPLGFHPADEWHLPGVDVVRYTR
jgi:mannosyltransferase